MAEERSPEQEVESQKIFDRLWSVFVQHFPSVARDASKRLFHYTNAAGLKGIVDSHRIWATGIEYLNDSSEMTDAEKLLDDEVEAFSKKNKAIDALALPFGGTGIWRALRPKTSCFVFCLTEKGDDLNQWTQYSGVGGFALEFARTILRPSHPLKGARIHSGRVVYGDRLKKRFVRELLGTAVECGDWHEEISSITSYVLGAAQPLMKNEAFSNEREWRTVLFQPSSAHAHVRSKGNHLVPYLEVAHNTKRLRVEGLLGGQTRLPLKRVICGPGPHQDLSHKAAAVLLSRHYSDAEIAVSPIPLRPLT